MTKIFEFINLDIQEVADFIEDKGLSFVCNDKMQIESSEEDFETLIDRFPELDYAEAEVKSMDEIAAENGLELVETTSEGNGYPSHLREAITGFESFGQAEEVAKEYGLELIWIDKRDGWQLWHRGSAAYEPMTITSEDYGGDYGFEDDKDAFLDYARETIVNMCNNEASFDDIRTYMDDAEEVADAIDNLEDGESVVTCCGKYYDTIKVRPISFSYDTKHTQLAAI